MTYPGGKAGAGVYQTLINQIPPHTVYLEPFAGGAAVLRHKRPAPAGSLAADRDAAALSRLAMLDIPGVELLHGCGLELLRTYPFRGTEFVYADPPYLMDVRSTRRAYYACEFATVKSTRSCSRCS